MILIILSTFYVLSQSQLLQINNSYGIFLINYSPSTFGFPVELKTYGTAEFINPINGCIDFSNSDNNVAIIERGNCSFVTKVFNAQNSNYSLVIVYDNIIEDLITMYGNNDTVDIPSIFISLGSSFLLTNESIISIIINDNKINNIQYVRLFIIIIVGISVFGIIYIVIKIYKKIRQQRINIQVPITNHIEIVNPINLDNPIIEYNNINSDTTSISSSSSSCIICQAEIKNDSYTFKNTENGGCDCNIIFHKECMKTWFNTNSSCPLCRKTYT